MAVSQSDIIKPYQQEGSKKAQVAEMFNSISSRYDLLNHLLSLNIDKSWRKKAIKLISVYNPKHLLDVATGTCDFAIEIMRIKPTSIVGIDISEGMLEVGKQKIKQRQFEGIIQLELGDAENIKFDDETFEGVTVAFGVRNFENLQIGLREIRRVLKTGYPLAILEFSKPRLFPFKQLYWFYFKAILPVVGRMISKDSRAYTYLPESVMAFPEGSAFIEELKIAGFQKIKEYRLTGGVATIYVAEK